MSMKKSNDTMRKDEKVCRQKEGKSEGGKMNRRNWSKWHRRWAGVKNNKRNSGKIRGRQKHDIKMEAR